MEASAENQGLAPRVLSTLNPDGSRRWLKPRVSSGRFLTARRLVGWALICVFTLTPFLKIRGKPAVLLDVVTREFTFLGKTFYPTDTLLLALLMVSVFVTIFLFTAIFGRVWCGWACPQTVYMEFVFRPIERFFEGAPGRARKGILQTSGAGKLLKHAAFLVVSVFLANTFLAWFVGVERLWGWMHRSPFDHPTGFLVVLAVTALMLFDFGYFREQLCIVACPYGRFQSALLDRGSIIVGYDRKRGEPRGKPGRDPAPPMAVALTMDGAPLPAHERTADCVDCGMCVTTCPTGIDIRNGLQMECVNCAQCIDACDAVMTKLKRPRGLIRYSSLAAMEGPKRTGVRARVIIYPALLAILLTAFVTVLATKGATDVTVLRGMGRPYSTLDSGEIANPILVKIRNRADTDRSYQIEVAGIDGARLIVDGAMPTLKPGQIATVPVVVAAPSAAFSGGSREVSVRIADSGGYSKSVPCRLMGPAESARHEDKKPDEDHDKEPEEHPR